MTRSWMLGDGIVRRSTDELPRSGSDCSRRRRPSEARLRIVHRSSRGGEDFQQVSASLDVAGGLVAARHPPHHPAASGPAGSESTGCQPMRAALRQRGLALRWTVTGNWQVDSFPAASVAVQSTRVVPGRNRLPEGGVQTMLGEESTSSVAVMVKVTISPFPFANPSTTRIDEGQVSTGAVVSQPHLAR